MMNKKTGAMFHSVALDKKTTGSDGAGGTVVAWQEQFTCRASYSHLRGGEGVQAARLEGKHPQIIRIRSSIAAKLVTSEWRVRDLHNNADYNIRDVTPAENRRYIEFLCERGVAV